MNDTSMLTATTRVDSFAFSWYYEAIMPAVTKDGMDDSKMLAAAISPLKPVVTASKRTSAGAIISL